MLAIVAVASAAGSASLRSLPWAFIRVRPSRTVRFPAVEAGGDRRSSFGIALGELPGERAYRATAARLLFDLVLDHELEPAVDAGPRIEVVEQLVLPPEHGVGGGLDDGPDHVVTVFEVVIELAATGAGARADVIEAHTGDALLRDELGCGLHNPLAHRASPRRRGCVRRHHDHA